MSDLRGSLCSYRCIRMQMSIWITRFVVWTFSRGSRILSAQGGLNGATGADASRTTMFRRSALVLSFGVWLAVVGWLAFPGSQQASVRIGATQSPKLYRYEVLGRYPHDRQAFTQGLTYHDGYLYESTGLQGQSSLRKVDLNTGRVLRKIDLD